MCVLFLVLFKRGFVCFSFGFFPLPLFLIFWCLNTLLQLFLFYCWWWFLWFIVFGICPAGWFLSFLDMWLGSKGWIVFIWNFLLVVVIINSNIWFLSFFSFWYSHYPHLTMLTVTLFLKFLSPICSLFVFQFGKFQLMNLQIQICFLFYAQSVIMVLLLPPPSTLLSPVPLPLSLILIPYSS